MLELQNLNLNNDNVTYDWSYNNRDHKVVIYIHAAFFEMQKLLLTVANRLKTLCLGDSANVCPCSPASRAKPSWPDLSMTLLSGDSCTQSPWNSTPSQNWPNNGSFKTRSLKTVRQSDRDPRRTWLSRKPPRCALLTMAQQLFYLQVVYLILPHFPSFPLLIFVALVSCRGFSCCQVNSQTLKKSRITDQQLHWPCGSENKETLKSWDRQTQSQWCDKSYRFIPYMPFNQN